jgi:secondary thiamine-phosphate synthase enzyme
MIELRLSTSTKNEMVNITYLIKDLIDKEEFNNGMVFIYIPHTTAAVTINEGADPDVCDDIIRTLNRLVPESNDYKHSEGNSDAHVKASLLGVSEQILVQDGKLVLGTWQHVFFFEGDGPRNRKVFIQLIPHQI